jgi:hypothetical protein
LVPQFPGLLRQHVEHGLRAVTELDRVANLQRRGIEAYFPQVAEVIYA